MSLDLGDPWPDLSITNTDANGTPADATLLKLTITAPDGTVPVSNVTVTSTSAGIYSYDFTPTMVGRWVAKWSGTGSNAAALTQVENVYDMSSLGVALGDVKRHLQFHGLSTTDDDELLGFVLTATSIVENVIGPIAPVTKTEVIRAGSGYGNVLALSYAPVMSVTSITPYSGAVIDVSTLAPDFTNGLVRFASPWGRFFVTPTTVVYKVGRTSVPPEVRTAILDLIRINWRPQQGGNRSAFDEAAEGPGSYELGFFVPNGVIGSLAGERLPGVVA